VVAVDLDKARAANEAALYGPDRRVEVRPDGTTVLEKRPVSELLTQQGLIDVAERRASGRPARPVTVTVGSKGMWR